MHIKLLICSLRVATLTCPPSTSSQTPPIQPHLEFRLPCLHPLNLPRQPLRLPVQILLHSCRRLGALPLSGQLAAGALLLRHHGRLLLRLLAQRLLQALHKK